MTLWNPLNVFSGRTHSAADGPSASFDPSRTGDPLGPRPTDPTIGIGGTQPGGLVSAGDPRRNPIGFAPPAEQDAETRFRTEISFRRHHELPRASATPVTPEDGEQASWQSPHQPGPADVEQVDVAEDAPVAESVPFYRREIGFRRKKSAPVEVVAHEDVVEEHEDAVEAAEPETLVVAEAVTSEDDAVEEAAAEPLTPFYKREISFRRNTAAVEVAVAAEVVDAVADEETNDVSDEPAEHVVEPEPEVVAAVDEPEALEDDVPAEVVAEEPQVEYEAPAHETARVVEVAAAHELDQPDAQDEALDALPSADTTDHAWHTEDATHEPATVEPVTFEPEAVVEDVATTEDVEEADDLAPLPAAVAIEAFADMDAVPDLPGAGADGVADEDAPATGRFGSRRRKSEKAPKRQGGKGRKVVGLKIGASQLAAAVVSETDRGHELLGLARRPLAAGIVVDGEVRDEAALANAVRSFFDDEKLPKGDVRIGLSSNRIGVRTLDIDGVEDESRFDNAVRFKAHEVLPVALSESVLDYRVLEERMGEDGARTRRVLLVVAPRDQVEPYTRVASLAGIRIEALDLEALGLLRAFVAPGTGAPTPDDTASVVVSIGHESSTLLVAGGGVCEFTRVFDWGGGALEDAVASALEVRPAEAATILRHLSLSGPGRQYEALDEVTRAKATDAVRQRLTPFARELVNSLQFYQTQAQSLGIGGIQITGGTSHLEGIEHALHQMIGVNVSVGDPLSRVVCAADLDPSLETAIGSLAVPIGLAIHDVTTRGVNLLPMGTVTKTSRRSTLIKIGAPVAVAVPLAALSFLYLGAHGKVVDQQTQLDAAKAELAALPQPTAPVIDSAVVGDAAVRATAVANVIGGRLAWEAVFRDMSKVLPANVWLSTLSLSAPDATNLADGTVAGAAPAAAGVQPVPTAVAIDGYTFTQPGVARLLARLATLPSLKRVTLTSSQSQLVGSKKVVHFVIVADLNQTGGAS